MSGTQLPAEHHPAHPSWPVFGHEWAVEYLQGALEAGHGEARRRGPRHAYLFLGPAQIGKSTLVRAFAQALLCTGDGTRPCGQCRSCRLMSSGNHPDFRLVQPVTTGGEIDRAGGMLRVEQASAVIHDAALSPVEGRYRVFAIQDAHRANGLLQQAAQNAGGAGGVVICLTAADRGSLLPTIISRCEVLEETRPSCGESEGRISSGMGRHSRTPNFLARLCNGRLGWAVRQLGTGCRDTAPGHAARVVASCRSQSRRTARFRRTFGAAAREPAVIRHALRNLGDVVAGRVLGAERLPGARSATSTSAPRSTAKPGLAGRPSAASSTPCNVERYLHHTVNTRLAMDVLLLELRLPA